MKVLGFIAIKMAAVALTAWFLPGVMTSGIWPIFWLVIVLVPIDFIIKPIIHILSLPFTIITLGIFGLIVNGAMVMIASYLVPGFKIDGLLTAVIFSVILGVVAAILNRIFLNNK